jgi:hypothetical protein
MNRSAAARKTEMFVRRSGRRRDRADLLEQPHRVEDDPLLGDLAVAEKEIKVSVTSESSRWPRPFCWTRLTEKGRTIRAWRVLTLTGVKARAARRSGRG